MTTEQALQVLAQACARVQATWDEHIAFRQALQTLSEAVTPKPPKK